MTLDEIIAALEKAEGPSALLDAEIDCAVRFRDLRPALPTDFDGKYGYYEGDIKVEHGFLLAERYTASLDAALTLMPKLTDLSWALESGPPGVSDDAFARIWSEDGPEHIPSIRVTGSTPAIALCIAALRARSVAP